MYIQECCVYIYICFLNLIYITYIYMYIYLFIYIYICFFNLILKSCKLVNFLLDRQLSVFGGPNLIPNAGWSSFVFWVWFLKSKYNRKKCLTGWLWIVRLTNLVPWWQRISQMVFFETHLDLFSRLYFLSLGMKNHTLWTVLTYSYHFFQQV